MKRFLIILLALLVCIPSVYARKKSKKSGVIEDNIYTDAEYDFTIKILENWEAKLQKPKKMIRLALTQQDHEIPPELMQFPSMAMVPTLNIHIGEVDMPPAVYVDSLVSNTYSSDVKKDVMKDLLALEENVSFDGLKTTQKDRIEIDEKEACQWQGSVNYTKKLGMGDTIPRVYSVGIVALKKGDLMLTCLIETESMFFTDIFKEVLEMVHTIEWSE